MQDSKDAVYAAPRPITDVGDCKFYHTMEVPGYGLREGAFDLRKGTNHYLGKVDFRDKRVLELGTADGFLCFYMESQGANVVAYDLSEKDLWDIVPHATADYGARVQERRQTAKGLNNAFWLCHKAYGSKARMAYGNVYSVPKEIGMVDIATFSAILLHVRDPFLALQSALRLTKETVIITETFLYVPDWILKKLHAPPQLRCLFKLIYDLPPRILEKLRVPIRVRDRFGPPMMEFVPMPDELALADTWWRMSPELIRRMIAVLGFEKSNINYHWYKHSAGYILSSTIVGHRTIQNYNY